MVLVVGFGAALINAVMNVFLKVLFNNASTKELAPLSFLLGFITMAFFSPIYFHFIYSLNTIIILLLIFILDSFANYFYYRSIEVSEVSYVSIYLSLSPIFTLLVSTFIINILPLSFIIAVAGIVMSIYTLNLNGGTGIVDPFLDIFKNKNYLGLFAAIFFGVSAVLTKVVFDSNSINPSTLFLFRSAFIFLVFLLLMRPKFWQLDFNTVILAWVRVLFIIGYMLLYLYAISFGNVVTAVTISSIYPMFVLMFSHFLFKEKITFQKTASILSVLAFTLLLFYKG